MKIVTVEQMQAIEKSADAAGLHYDDMMRHAGEGIAEWVTSNLETHFGVMGLVGPGNNGGDTLIALTALSHRGVRTLAFLAKTRKQDSLMEDYVNAGGVVIDIAQGKYIDYLQAALIPGIVVLDGILGTGVKLPIRGELLALMDTLHDLIIKCPGALVVAVDCPSGLDCDTGEISEVTLSATVTLCLAAIKQGLLIHPGRSVAGELHVLGIGIKNLSDHITDRLPEMIDSRYVEKNLPERPDNGHKGTFGTCMVIAGTAPFTGAALFSGKAAYLSGCGLVHIGTISRVQESLSGQLLEAIWTTLPDIDGGYEHLGIGLLQEDLEKVDSLVVGPGLGVHKETETFITDLLKVIPRDLPTLFDADGLKLLQRIEHWWELLPKQTILTPHPGEMSVLTGIDIDQIQSDRWMIAKEYAKKWKVVLVLKGAVTVVATPDGGLYINPISSSALATAGSGDVLSGVIGGLLAQGIQYVDAARIGVWLHGRAGLIAQKKLRSNRSVTAMDILNNVRDAMV